jgi:polygalacturonase
MVIAATVLSAQTTRNVGPGQAYPTIQSAIIAAANGDTVLVAPGTYSENIDFLGKAITVTSSGGGGRHDP